MVHVMVPVPEELLEQVDELLLKLRLGLEASPFDSTAMGEYLLSLDEQPRGVLLEVAAAVVAGQPLDDVELADILGITVRELFGLLTDVNDVTVRVFTGSLVTADRRTDPTDPERSLRRLRMLDGYALMVVEQRAVLGLRRPTRRADLSGPQA